MQTPPYLQSPDPDIWNVDLNEQAFQWGPKAGELASRTIAFFPEVDALLTSLADAFDGLPDFSGLLFLFSASVNRASANALARRALASKPVFTRTEVHVGAAHLETEESPGSVRSRFRDLFDRTRLLCDQDGVTLARLLAEVYEVEVSKNIALFPRANVESAFQFLRTEPHERLLPPSAVDLLAPQTATVTGEESLGLFIRCWNFLEELARSPIDTSTAELKLATGAEQLPSPADIEEISDREFAGLIALLESDDEMGEVSSAARHVASVASLPLSPSDPSELPIGGVSDITNRGSPERLLMTELAADPMLLIARIATGKALYLRRETPPNRGELARTILIESSVRTWGQTRVRALAVALGLAASEQSRRNAAVEVVTLGDEVIVEKFSSKLGLKQHLMRLSAVPHPGSALRQWFERKPEEEESPVLVLAARTLKDESFRRSLRELDQELLLATIDHRGDVRIIRVDRMGETELRRLRVEELKLGETKRPLRGLPADDYPAFVRLPRSPLRFSNNSSPTWCVASHGAGLWLRTPDQRLLFYDRKGKGGLTVLERFQFDEVKAHRVSGSILELVIRQQGQTQYLRIDPYDGVSHLISLRLDADFVFDLSSLFARDRAGLHLIDKSTGEVLDSELSDDWELANGVPFRTPKRFQASNERDALFIAQQTGNQIRWHRFAVAKGELGIDAGPPVGWRGPGDVPVLVAARLDRIKILGESDTSVPVHAPRSTIYSNTKLERVSSDGKRAILKTTALVSEHSAPQSSRRSESATERPFAKPIRVCLELQTGKLTNVSGGPINELMRLNESALGYYRQIETMGRFTGVGVTSRGLFLMRRRSKPPFLIVARDQMGFQAVTELMNRDVSPVPFGEKYVVPSGVKETTRHVGPPESDWGLRLASFGDARVWLDSRGLLHFSIRDDSRQLTFVIQSQAQFFGGWFSDSGVFGASYYHERQEGLATPPAVFQWYRRWLQVARES
ncbi:MAG: hypothetical protein AAFU85_18400 [Planctomycetota bacterium]